MVFQCQLFMQAALGNVLRALSTNQDHIPYRDSCLTKQLKQSFEGSDVNVLICLKGDQPREYDSFSNTI